MNKLGMRHWSRVSCVLFLKNTTYFTRELSLVQNCRCMSKKVVIRWPKAFPGPDKPQKSKTKFSNSKKWKGGQSVPEVKSFGRSSGKNELSDDMIMKNESDEYEDELTLDEIEEMGLDEFENLKQREPKHFSETDLGMSGTFIVKGRNTDRVLEDLKTSQIVNGESNLIDDVEANVGDGGQMDFSERLGNMHNRGVGSSLRDNLKELKDAKDTFDERFHGRVLSKVDDVDEDTRNIPQKEEGIDISSDEEELPNEESAVSADGDVSHPNTLERKSKSWKETPLMKRQNQFKQRQRQKKLYVNPKNEVLFGISPCLLALMQSRRQIINAFVLEAFEISARPEAQEIMKMLQSKGVKIHVRSRGELNRLSQDRPHQGICLEVSRLHFENLAEVSGELITADADSRVCLLALDKIMDPMNLGAIMRSAYFLGVDTVVANKQNCCPLTPIVSKASSGICEVMPIYSANDMGKFLGELGDHGWHIMGATSESDTGQGDSEKPILPCREVKLSKRTVLVIGSEGFGLRKSIQGLCHTFVTVPPGRTLHLGIDSLNVSVATGILLHSLLVNR
ncbi:rRNA methyltransferase 1, mitochondrial [Holothuria leucospilota]|uniref:rRNA methyltransferase 1, mitochondrial n=1 Tax=Holothuria leucospilota TaxID=206669 RepID=A0A9Q1HEY6_HOLLE|nr:rRNA methyltransferase 1, mitochondrial [Holothuria leucospilota]